MTRGPGLPGVTRHQLSWGNLGLWPSWGDLGHPPSLGSPSLTSTYRPRGVAACPPPRHFPHSPCSHSGGAAGTLTFRAVGAWGGQRDGSQGLERRGGERGGGRERNAGLIVWPAPSLGSARRPRGGPGAGRGGDRNSSGNGSWALSPPPLPIRGRWSSFRTCSNCTPLAGPPETRMQVRLAPSRLSVGLAGGLMVPRIPCWNPREHTHSASGSDTVPQVRHRARTLLLVPQSQTIGPDVKSPLPVLTVAEQSGKPPGTRLLGQVLPRCPARAGRRGPKSGCSGQSQGARGPRSGPFRAEASGPRGSGGSGSPPPPPHTVGLGLRKSSVQTVETGGGGGVFVSEGSVPCSLSGSGVVLRAPSGAPAGFSARTAQKAWPGK